MIQFLQNRITAHLNIVFRFRRSSGKVDDCVIKIMSSDAESRKEQDGGRQNFVE